MPNAGDLVRAVDIPVTEYINKSGSESVTSSTVLQSDDHLTTSLAVGQWRIQIYLTATGAASPGDIRVAWTNTGTMTAIARSCFGPGSANTDVTGAANNAHRDTAQTFTANVIYGTDGTNSSAIHEDLLIDVTVAGTITLQWAQGTSSGTATTLSTSSRMYITPVEAAS